MRVFIASYHGRPLNNNFYNFLNEMTTTVFIAVSFYCEGCFA
jgi:hypothetical protein